MSERQNLQEQEQKDKDLKGYMLGSKLIRTAKVKVSKVKSPSLEEKREGDA